MTLVVKSVNGEPVIEGTAERVEHFSTALLAHDTTWLRVVDDRIVLTDGTRTVVYRVTYRPPGGEVADDNTFVFAALVSDTRRERSQ